MSTYSFDEVLCRTMHIHTNSIYKCMKESSQANTRYLAVFTLKVLQLTANNTDATDSPRQSSLNNATDIADQTCGITTLYLVPGQVGTEVKTGKVVRQMFYCKCWIELHLLKLLTRRAHFPKHKKPEYDKWQKRASLLA